MSEKSKFAAFLQEKKLDVRRIRAASHDLESLRREDRAIRRAKRIARGGEAVEGATKETRKPRSGRPVTQRAIDAAMTGKAVSGPTKQRILKAVNRLLEQKKGSPVELKALF